MLPLSFVVCEVAMSLPREVTRAMVGDAPPNCNRAVKAVVKPPQIICISNAVADKVPQLADARGGEMCLLKWAPKQDGSGTVPGAVILTSWAALVVVGVRRDRCNSVARLEGVDLCCSGRARCE